MGMLGVRRREQPGERRGGGSVPVMGGVLRAWGEGVEYKPPRSGRRGGGEHLAWGKPSQGSS